MGLDSSNSKKEFSIGIIGSGSHMIEHLLPALREIGENEVVAVCTRTLQTYESNKYLYPLSIYYSNLEGLIKSKLVDIVIVASNPDVHLQALLGCWKANKPIFIEKPVTLDVRLIPSELLHSNFAKKKVFIGYNLPHAEIPELFLAKIKSNRSRPVAVALRCFANKPSQPIWKLNNCFDSFIYAVGIHAIDFAIKLTSLNEIVSLATCYRESSSGKFSSTSILLDPKNINLSFSFSNMHPSFLWEIDVQLDNGNMLRLDGTKSMIEMFEKDGNKERKTTTQLSVLSSSSNNGYVKELQSFFYSVSSKTISKNSLNKDILTLELCRQLIKSREETK